MTETNKIEAVLLVSFGGPEGPNEVMPFLENVARGRNIPRERLEEVAEHYQAFGGVSPINAQCRDLIAAMEAELTERGKPMKVYWGNRNWRPVLADTMKQMADDGVRHAAALVTSAFSCYSGCRQYREDIERAQQEVGTDRAPTFAKLRVFYNHPGFVAAMRDNVREALKQWPTERRDGVRIVFTAHSIPTSMAKTSRYEAQLYESSRLVAEPFTANAWELVYQSRSGPPQMPWLEPDVCDHLERLHAGGVNDVVLAPIGFISDHMEVVFDLDTEAKQLCAELGVTMVRAATVGTATAFVKGLADLIEERIANEIQPGSCQRPALGCHGPSHDLCPADCCLPPQRPAGKPGSPHPHATRGA